MQFVSTVSSFLRIMIRHNVDFCKNQPRFMPLIIFHLNCILLLIMKMNKKQFLFHSWKIRAEGRSPLSSKVSFETEAPYREKIETYLGWKVKFDCKFFDTIGCRGIKCPTLILDYKLTLFLNNPTRCIYSKFFDALKYEPRDNLIISFDPSAPNWIETSPSR